VVCAAPLVNNPGDSFRSAGFRFGKYEVVARLGRGGMAHVYLAVSRGLGGFNKLVVIKRLDSDDDAFRRMFLEEARLAALLNHPNVVSTYEVAEDAGQYFIAMEYLDGQPLDKVVREMKRVGRMLEPRFCARVVADALNGLHYTHELRDYSGAPLNIVHRDISPHNLFLTFEGTVKVLDFGVAKTAERVSDRTQLGVLKGKLAYMAPEQAAGDEVDRRADVFSVGLVFWELLTLERLRMRDSAAGVLNQALYGAIPSLSQVRPGLDPGLEQILKRALTRDRRRRYQSAQEMRDALLEFLATAPCSQEDLSEFMRARFSEARASMQQQIRACLRAAERQDPVISVQEIEDSRELHVIGLSAAERALPILESGSLPESGSMPLRAPDDVTAELGPSSDLARPLTPSQHRLVTPRPRLSSIGLEHEPDSGWLRYGLYALLLAAAFVAGWVLWRRPSSSETARVAASSPAKRGEIVLRLHGSNTIGQELAPRLAVAFMKKRGMSGVLRRPGSEVEQTLVSGNPQGSEKPQEIEIRARGSSTAFEDLGNRSCDIGLASRRIKPDEVAQLRDRGLGDLSSPAGEHVLGLDGIAVIVHPNNALERIEIPELRGVFTGAIDDFSKLGQPPGRITLYARDDQSGTYDTFKHLVLNDEPLRARARRFTDSAELSGAVATDPRGVGFIGIAYTRGAKALAIAEADSAALFPSAFTVATEGYPLSRRLYLYLPVENVNPLALEFVNFALSPEGQEVVRASGFVDLTLQAIDAPSCGKPCPARYAALTKGARRLSLDFRFRTGSVELDSRGQRDLDRLIEFLRGAPGTRLTLIGFSDSRGSFAQNAKLSLERAKNVGDELAARGVQASIQALGHELPVASNETEEGREKNRRVEVWVR
jgi:phosphate transport system substrate-binding protein